MSNKTLPIPAVPVTLVNWVLFFVGLANLLAGTWYLYHHEGTLAAAGVGSGLVLVMFATIDRFELLKGLGMEAKTRELNRTLTEAETIVAQMRHLAELTSTALVQLNARAGRLSGAPPAQESYDLSRGVKRVLQSSGSSEPAIRLALKPWATMCAFDIARDLLAHLGHAVQEEATARKRTLDQMTTPNTASDPLHLAKMDEVQSMWAFHTQLPRRLSDLPLEGVADHLRHIAATAPSFVPSTALDQFRAEVEAWAPEIENLAAELDFLNRERCIKRLGDILTGARRP